MRDERHRGEAPIAASGTAAYGQRQLPAALPACLDLTPLERRPLRLSDETIRAVTEMSLPHALQRDAIALPPRASIVIVTFNNLLFTRMCLASVLADSECGNVEVIVVDNASTDATPQFLSDAAQCDSRVRPIFNDRNRGFAAANNLGLRAAGGECLVLLNNDTIVPPGWLHGLSRHLKDPAIGAVGPVTNRIDNEAQIDSNYRTYGEFLSFANERRETYSGEAFDLPMLCMYCLAMRREVFERVGPLDERFGIGLFEDDDYSLRVHKAGYRVACADDVFVHHFGGASFANLVPTGEFATLFNANRARFREKWGVEWTPHEHRRTSEYEKLRERLKRLADELLPQDSTVLVVSKGDESLLRLGQRDCEHFPQDERGNFSGYYPESSTAAIAHLDELAAKGAQYILFPQPAFWWLDHYAEFGRHLATHYYLIHPPDETCVIYGLRDSDQGITRDIRDREEEARER